VDSSIERDRKHDISPSSTNTEEESGTEIRLEGPAVRRIVSKKGTQELNDELILWKKDMHSSETELFDSRLLALRDLPANTAYGHVCA